MTVLVSGTNSGLGKYLQRQFEAEAYRRHAPDTHCSHYEMIIHAACGAPPREGLHSPEANAYVAEQAALCDALLSIPHRRFVYISSIDIYAGQNNGGKEEASIDPALCSGAYAKMKFRCEQQVRDNAAKPLILRPAALLGGDMRPNSAMRMLSAQDQPLSLAAESSFNYVLHSQVMSLVERLNRADFVGTINVVSGLNVTLGDLARQYDCQPEFGQFIYQTPEVDGALCTQFLPDLAQTSQQLFTHFWEQVKSKFCQLD